jgi:glycerate kinase
MKIVIAPDSFKGNLNAMQAARAIEAGIRRVLPEADCVKVPMADGGEGTVQSLVDGSGGRFIRRRVTGPAGRRVSARYGMLADRRTAVIEMAAASGLPLVSGRARNPLKTTTRGTGELIIDALDKGARRIIIGIGGSATNDGGAGMAQALGVRFLDGQGRVIRECGSGGMLARVAAIDMSGRHTVVSTAEIIVACDVSNRLCGPRGASAVFGPQKGATPSMVRQLDANLRHFGSLIRRDLGINVLALKGGGAAGGLGAGLVAFAGASLQSGIDIVIDAVGLQQHLQGAALIITAEGRIDSQTAFGKTPAGVAQAARRAGVPVIAIGGGLADDARSVFRHGIDGLESTIVRDLELEEALANAARNLADAAERAMRLVLIGSRINVRKSGRRQKPQTRSEQR